MKILKTHIIGVAILSLALWLAPAHAFIRVNFNLLISRFNLLISRLSSIKENIYQKYPYLKKNVKPTLPTETRKYAWSEVHLEWLKPETHALGSLSGVEACVPSSVECEHCYYGKQHLECVFSLEL